MKSVERLCEITGYNVGDYSRFLGLRREELNNLELTVEHMKTICKQLEECTSSPGNHIILLTAVGFFRGVILHNTKTANENGTDHSSVIVAYTDDQGKRFLVNLAQAKDFYYGIMNDFSAANEKVFGFIFPLKIEEVLDRPQPIGEFYDTVFESGSISVGKNEKGYFFVNTDGERVSLFFDDIVYDPCNVFRLKKDSLYGLADTYGNVLIYPRYLEIDPFSEGLGAFKKIHLWGFLDTVGRVAIEPIYTSVETFVNGYSKVSLPIGDTPKAQGFINNKGNAVIKGETNKEFVNFCFVLPYGPHFIGVKHFNSIIEQIGVVTRSRKTYLLLNGAFDSSIILGDPNPSFDYCSGWDPIYDEKTKLYGLLSDDKLRVINSCFISILKGTKDIIVGYVPSIKTSLESSTKPSKNGWDQLTGCPEANDQNHISTRDKSGCWLFANGCKLEGSAKYDECITVLLEGSNERIVKTVFVVVEKGKYGLVDSSNNPIIETDFEDIILPTADDHYYDSIYDDSEWLKINGNYSHYHNYYVLNDDVNGHIIVKKKGKWYSYSYDGKPIWGKGYNDVLSYAGFYILQDSDGFGIMWGDEILSPCANDSIKVKLFRNQSGHIKFVAFLLRKGSKQGLCIITPNDPVKVHSVEACYESISISSNGFIVKNTKYGLLGLDSSVILDIQYDCIEFLPETGRYLVTQDGLQGIVDLNGRIVIEIEYKQISELGRTYHLISKNGLHGIFGIIPCDYTDVKCLNNCYIVTKKKQHFFVSADGKIIYKIDSCDFLDRVLTYGKKPTYGKETRIGYNTGKQKEYVYPDSDLFAIWTQNRMGVINSMGVVVVPCNYDGAGIIEDGILLAWTREDMRLFSSDGKHQSEAYDAIKAISTSGNKKASPSFYLYKGAKKGLMRYFDSSFQVDYPCIFDELDVDSISQSRVIDGSPIQRIILGPDGNRMNRPDEYLWMSDFSYSGIAIAVKDGRFGLIDCNLNCLKPFEYDNILKVDAFHYLLSSKSNSYLIRYDTNLLEQALHSYEFSVVNRLVPNVFCVRRDGKYGAFHYNQAKEELELFLDVRYNSISGHDNTFVVVQGTDGYGCYDKEGSVLLEEKYISIEPMYNKYESRFKNYPSDFLIGNVLIAKHRNDDGIINAHTVYSYKSRKSVVISMTNIAARYINEYEKNCGVYIVFRDSNNRYGVISNDCSRISDTFEKIECKPCYSINNQSGFYVSNHNLWGYLDYKTLNSIPCRFNQKVYYGDIRQRFWVIEEQESKTRQFYDSKLKHIVPISNIISIDAFSSDKWLVSVIEGNHQIYGLYNDKMEVIIPIYYDRIEEGLQDQFIASLKEEHSYRMASSAIYNSEGRILFPLSDGAIIIKWDNYRKPICYCKDNEDDSLVSYNGKDFIQSDEPHNREYISWGSPHYYSDTNEDGTSNVITRFGVEYFFVEETNTQDEITTLKISGKYIVINQQKELSNKPYESVFVDTYAKYISLKDGDSYVFIDYQGEELGKIQGSFSTCVLDKEAKVIRGIRRDCEGNKHYQLFSNTGTLLNDTSFSYIGTFSEGFATCVIDSENPIDKDFLKHTRDFHFFESDHGKWGLIDTTGKVVIPMRYDFIRPVKGGLTVYSKDHKFGVINPSQGKSTIAKFTYLDSFHEGLCRFRLSEEFNNSFFHHCGYSDFGFINERSEIVIPPVFFDVSSFNSGVAIVKSKDGFKNQIDKNGNLLDEWREIPVSRDDYEDHDYGYTQSELDDMYKDAFDGIPEATWNID